MTRRSGSVWEYWQLSGVGSAIGGCTYCWLERVIRLNHKRLFRLYRQEKLK